MGFLILLCALSNIMLSSIFMFLQSSMNFFSVFRFNLDSGTSNIIMFLLLLLLPTNEGTVMFLHLCIILFGGLCQGGLCPEWGLCLGESLSGSVQGVLCEGHPLHGKERAVRILLECILVTRKHSSRMHTVLCSGRRWGGGVFAREGAVYPSMH